MPVTYDDNDHRAGALFDRGYGLSYTQADPVGRLPEDPQIPPDRGDADSLFHAAHVTAPWSLFVADKLAQVRVTANQQVSPSGTVRVALATGLTVAWSGSGPGDFWIGGRPVDLRAAARHGDVVQARFRIEQPPAGSVRVGVRCSPTSQAAETGCGMGGGAMLDATQALTSARRGGWATLSVPLVCFADRAAGLSSVAAPFALRTEGKLALIFTDVHLVHAAVQQCRLAVQ
jgi:beta-glucosidase